MSEAKLMRTSMYAGGTSPVKMIQAGFYNEDCLVYDLEDSVSSICSGSIPVSNMAVTAPAACMLCSSSAARASSAPGSS